MNRLIARIGSIAPWRVALGLLALLAARDAQNLLRPEFYAEDGVWYAQAYTQGLASLALPQAGYLNTVQRVAAVAAQPLPLAWAPLAFSLYAYALYAALLLFLLSPRLGDAWPQRGVRILFALLLVLAPATEEVFGVLTNTQWILAPLAFLVLASAPPVRAGGRCFDAAVLFLGGLSGPFFIALVPLAARQWQRREDRRDRARMWRLLLLSGAAAVQAVFLLFNLAQRPAVQAVGADGQTLLRILAVIAMQAELGARLVGHVVALSSPWRDASLPGIALGLAAIGGYALGWRAAPPLLRQFMVFAVLMFAAALYRPVVDPAPGLLQWPLMAAHPPAGGRYYFFLLLAWWGGMFAIVARRRGIEAALARMAIALTLCVGVPLDWPRWHADGHDAFMAQARAFAAAAPGTRFVIPVRPAWFTPLVLTRK
ncbi:MAG TPA: hypothetical protein VGN52_02930 [Burkholderiales bacterium]